VQPPSNPAGVVAPGSSGRQESGATQPLACGNCGQPMQRHQLAGHYSRSIEIDLCAPCHLLWFDSVESVRLTGAALLELVGAMAGAHGTPHHALGQDVRCPRCSGGLKRVHNRSRWGATQQLECLRGHGAWQTFAQFLSEKGYVRELTAADRAALLQADAALACVNCGAPLSSSQAACSWCGSLAGLVDVARLARALDPDDATELAAVRQTAPQRHVFACHACGAAVPEGTALACAACGATLASPDLRRAYDALRTLEPALRAHAHQPAPHVRARRLQALRGDVERRRQWVRQMEQSAGVPAADEAPVDPRAPLFGRQPPAWLRALAWALVALLVYGWLNGWGR
jgi:DNA-directed RNA polymerase subunit RPC12/RpoP